IGSVGSNTLASGLGSRSVTLTNSTEYVLVGSNYNGSFFQHLAIIVGNSNLPVRIYEFVASSKYSYRDGNKSFPDWIELHNPNNATVNLTGCGLSDDPAMPMKWTFPAGATIAPHGYLVVFADDSNQPYDPAGFLHANFNLNQDGESVVFSASNSVVIDAITNFPAQAEDLAYG